jgi:small subunit ribosomal protein S1
MAKANKFRSEDLNDELIVDEQETKAAEEFRQLLDQSLHHKKFEEGEVVSGTVLRITGDSVIVDVGFKSEGVVKLNEFTDTSAVKPGDKMDLYLEKVEDDEGQIVLSKQRADFIKVWDKVKESLDSEKIVEGRVVRRVKGGLIIDLMGVDAFLPASQIGLRPLESLDSLVGREVPLKVIKINKKRRNIVVSRRVVLDAERAKLRDVILAEIDKGQIREGVVKNITDFGVFIDLGGLDGLLHITDMSWGRINHPSEVLQIGARVKVKILEYDREKSRVSLGLKQLTPHPWENIETKFPVGAKIKGKIVSIVDYGAFIELERGVEGLIHISEMSWTKQVKHPSKLLAIGDEVDAVVLKIDKEGQKISLGLRQLEPDPWFTIDQKYPVGTKVDGKVRNVTNFGIFVEIEEGIDGLIHISDISWTKRIKHPSEVVKKGDKVMCVVTNIDKDNRRISLGIKQLEEDPWMGIGEKFRLGQAVHGKVNRPLERGLLVDMDFGFEGFVPVSELEGVDEAKLAETFKGGEELDLLIIEIDQVNRRIALSQKAQKKSDETKDAAPYLKTEGTGTVMGDALKEALQKQEEKKEEQKPEAGA